MKKKYSITTIISVLAVFALFYLLTALSLKRAEVSIDFSAMLPYWQRIRTGFVMTLIISGFSFVLSLSIGILAAVLRNSPIKILKYSSVAYVELIRGTPLIMQIYLFFYIIGTAWGVDNRLVAGVIILSIFEGAYIAEIIRGSLISLDQTQLEAAKAVGFNRFQTLHLVILPQLIARTLPALTGQFASIVKDSSLLSIIAVIELTHSVREISALNFRLFEAYFILGFLYLCITLPVSYLSKKLEQRFYYEH